MSDEEQPAAPEETAADRARSGRDSLTAPISISGSAAGVKRAISALQRERESLDQRISKHSRLGERAEAAALSTLKYGITEQLRRYQELFDRGLNSSD